MKKTSYYLLGAAALVTCCSISAAYAAKKTIDRNNTPKTVFLPSASAPSAEIKTVAYSAGALQLVDLTDAAERTVHAVVHIKSTINGRTQVVQEMPDLFDYMFGMPPRRRQYQTEPQTGYGSGVILSADGYIVTNNHVIEGADVVEVTLNDGRIYTASVVGTDSDTDLALIRIEGNDFPFIKMGNSDNLKLGEWVLAVGNPFNLTSSVTAGVVSAKSRKIGIYGNGSIESFIQTDAAINMGNSGGALVNASGELVGINSALESPTGTYAGYGFAIPTVIVAKVVSDLKEFGTVQRALLGIQGRDVASLRQMPENKDKDFGTVDGVYVTDVTDGGGAKAAGISSGDVIVAVNGKKLKTMAELQETVTRYRPGDNVNVTYIRDKKEKTVKVELKNSRGNTEIVQKADMQILGASFQEVPESVRRSLNLGYGVQVNEVGKGLIRDAGIQRGFIILKINNNQIRSVEDIERVYDDASKSQDQVLFISGVYSNGRRANFAIGLSED